MAFGSNIATKGLTLLANSSATRPARPMRILFAALDVPFPITSGRRLRNWALLQALAEDGHQVTIVYFDEPGASDNGRCELGVICRNVDGIPQPNRCNGYTAANWRRVQALTSALPYGAWRLRSLRYQRKLQEWLAREPFDALICDDIYVAANIPLRSDVPIVINKHGIGTVGLQRFLPNERNTFKKIYGQLELLKTRRWEASVCNQSALIMACSEKDRAEIALLSPGATVTIVPNVIDVREYEPAPSMNNHTVVFVAYMGWYPNQDAVEFFVTSVLPTLRILVPDVKFVAAGRNPPDDFRRLLCKVPGGGFTGTVPDIRSLISVPAPCAVSFPIG